MNDLLTSFERPSALRNAAGRADSSSWLLGLDLGRYLVRKLLGEGGMGVVVQALDRQCDEVVALKMMKRELAGDASFRERFHREAETASLVVHRHVVLILDRGECQGIPYLTMPLLLGETLESRLACHPPLSLADVIRIGREIAEGLRAAHEAGVIHRDIKPGNVWLEAPNGSVCLLDFGLAIRRADRRLTVSGGWAGTLAYMAPERTGGTRGGMPSDLFSLGVLLYEALTGTTRFLTGAWNFWPPKKRRAELPDELNDLIVRLLACNPDDRPDAAEVVAALRVMEQSRPAD